MDLQQSIAASDLDHWIWLINLLLLPMAGAMIRSWWQQKVLLKQNEEIKDGVKLLVERTTMSNAAIKELKDQVIRQSGVLDRLDRSIDKNTTTGEALIKVIEKLDDHLRPAVTVAAQK